MLIKLVNPKNEEETCFYAPISEIRLSSRGSTPANIDEYIDKKDPMTEHFINDNDNKPLRRIIFKLYPAGEDWEIFTNWNIYLMNDYGKTIEAL